MCRLISSSVGSRLPGGRYLRMFAMYASSRDSPMLCRSLSSSFPAAPTKGMPAISSLAPGASPMKRMSAWGFPLPKTRFVALSLSGQMSSRSICSLIFCSSSALMVEENSLFF